MASSTIFTLHGKGLKLDTRADIEPYLKDVDPTIIEEIHFGGNTIGVEASEALAEFLSKTTVLKVRKLQKFFASPLIDDPGRRLR
jgi:Ran GTPase-activating protein 1